MIQVFDCEQGSPEWHHCRAGIPTASRFADVLANGKKGEPSKTRRTYMLELAGERITGAIADSYSNAHMERGHEMEPAARSAYAFMKDAEPETVGFVRNGDKGCSPDSFIGDKGVLEIKSALPKIVIDRLLTGEPPPEHKPQVQGQLWVCERDWCDLALYWPGLPLFVHRSYRDESYIANLARAVAQFNGELAEIVSRIEAYTGSPREDVKQAFRDSVAQGAAAAA